MAAQNIVLFIFQQEWGNLHQELKMANLREPDKPISVYWQQIDKI